MCDTDDEEICEKEMSDKKMSDYFPRWELQVKF